MRVSPLILCCLSVLLSSGCTYSVHPILLKSDQTTDIDLSGTWALKPEPTERSDWCRFSMQSVDRGANYVGAIDGGKRFTARIGKLGADRFLQFSMAEQKSPESGLLSSVPVYVIARFEVVDDELRIFPVGQNRAIPWFDGHNIHYRLIDTGVRHCVLTDDTPTLQKLLKDHGDELFAKTGLIFTRKPVVARDDNDARQSELHGGKSLDQSIEQARHARDLEERHNAMQVVRNFGLITDRAKTLSVFTELLSDDAVTVRPLAAAGLRKAGRPTDPKALEELVGILSIDPTRARPLQDDRAALGSHFVYDKPPMAWAELVDVEAPPNRMYEQNPLRHIAWQMPVLDEQRHHGLRTDVDGRVCFPTLAPGAQYKLIVLDENLKRHEMKGFVVTANENLDLGDIVVKRVVRQ